MPRAAIDQFTAILPRSNPSQDCYKVTPRGALVRCLGMVRHDVVVVGAGVAGMRAAIEASRYGADYAPIAYSRDIETNQIPNSQSVAARVRELMAY